MEDSLGEQNHIVYTSRKLYQGHHSIVVEDSHDFGIQNRLRIDSTIDPILKVDEEIFGL